MRRRYYFKLSVLMVATGLYSLTSAALADSTYIAETKDSLWARPTLLESDGSAKAKLRQRGVAVDAWVTQFYQGVVSGDAAKDWQYGARTDLRVNIDGHKIGLWPGFSVNFYQEWVFGEDVNSLDTGVLIPPNAAFAFPRLGDKDQDTSLNVTQKFGERLSVSIGKFYLLNNLAPSPISGGGGLNTYWNTALAYRFTGLTPAYILGSISNLRTERASYTLMIYDPRNAQDFDVIRNPFSDGVTIAPGIAVPTRFFGLSGSVGLKGAYSTKERLDLSEIPQIVLPPESEEVLTKKGSWSITFSGYQYFWQDAHNPKIGWGVFYDAAVSDENPNPVSGHIVVGLGGSHKFIGHGLDNWGVGYFNYGLSDNLIDGLGQLGTDLRSERGIELFYNAGITPWLRTTVDLQWIKPGEVGRDDVVYAGVSMQTRF